MQRIAEPAATPLPDIVTAEGRESFAELARSLKPTGARVSKRRQAGERQPGQDLVFEDPEIPIEEATLETFLAEVDKAGEWVSALSWVTPVATIGRQAFLEQVLNWSTSDRDCGREVRYEESGRADRRCGNLQIHDVLVCRAA